MPRTVPGIDTADANIITTLDMKACYISGSSYITGSIPVTMAVLISPLWWLCPCIRDYGEPFKEAMWLDLVKERLTEKVYMVPCFVQDVHLIFHNHKMFYKVKGVSSFFCTSFPIFPNFRDSRTLQELYGPCPRERSKRVGLQKKTACKFQRW